MPTDHTPPTKKPHHSDSQTVWRRGNGVFHTNARPSLSPTKRKLPPQIYEGPLPVPPPEKITSGVTAAADSWTPPPEDPPAANTADPSARATDGVSFDDWQQLPGSPAPLTDGIADKKKTRNRVVLAVLIPVFAIVLVVSLWQIFSIQIGYKQASNEYDQLRQQVLLPGQAPASGTVPEEQGAQVQAALSLQSVMAMNPDCVGWIDIPSTALSYPVVRAKDNVKYLDHTFLGNSNSAGAIFMDYRNPADLQGPHIVLYGHNMKNGSMFGLLPQYLDKAYLQAHSTIILYNAGAAYTYQVFSARVTDAYDPSYQVAFLDGAAFSSFAEGYGAPQGTAQMLTLSTCTNVTDDERILVHAALVGISPL